MKKFIFSAFVEVEARDRQSAEDKFADLIPAHDYEFERDRAFDPDQFPNSYFPNWFDRHHVEEFAGRALTDAEWEEFRQSDGQADILSQLVREYVHDFFLVERGKK